MMKTSLGTILVLLLAAAPAYAQIPEELLTKDYQNCSGDGTDSQRNAYCACVRDGMRNWDLQTYIQTATEAAAAASSGAASQMPGQLETLAKACIAKIQG
jgi:hypothetical protein